MVRDIERPERPPRPQHVKDRDKAKQQADDNQAELDAVKTIVAALEPLNRPRRERAIEHAAKMMKIELADGPITTMQLGLETVSIKVGETPDDN